MLEIVDVFILINISCKTIYTDWSIACYLGSKDALFAPSLLQRTIAGSAFGAICAFGAI